MFTRLSPPAAHRSLRPRDRLCASVSHRPLRLPLRLLHVRGHEFPSQARCLVARGARSIVLGFYRFGHAKNSRHGRRAAGAAQCDVAVPWAFPPSGLRGAGRSDRHDQRLATSALCSRARRLRRQAHQRLARYARPGQVSASDALGRPERRAGRHQRRFRGGAQDQGQRSRAQGLQRSEKPWGSSNGRTGGDSM